MINLNCFSLFILLMFAYSVIQQVLEELKLHYAKSRKVAGEPELFFNLIEDFGSITATAQCAAKEQTRRNKLSHTKVYVKIVFNGKQVFTTDICQLQNDFTVKWAQIFNIFMITFPGKNKHLIKRNLTRTYLVIFECE